MQILKFLGSVVVPAIGKFVIKDTLTETFNNVKIAWTNLGYEHLGKRFFGKVEEPSEETTFQSNRLLIKSFDDLIIPKLGGESGVESRFSQISYLLNQQPNGVAGILTITDDADLNVFYVRDKNGVLCSMSVALNEAGWFVVIYSIKAPEKWYAGVTFISHFPSLP